VPRQGHSLASVGDGKALLLFGGSTTGPPSSDLMVFNMETSRWSVVEAPAGSPCPPPRSWHAALVATAPTVFEEEAAGGLWAGKPHEGVLVFGGVGRGAAMDEQVWALSAAGAWVAVERRGEPPAPRFAHISVLFDADSRLLIMGGADGVGGRLVDASVTVRELCWTLTPGPGGESLSLGGR
jgi:hypothetical protein